MLADDVDGALAITDRTVLQDCLGLSERDTKEIRGIWVKLRNRRLNRKFRKAIPTPVDGPLADGPG